MFIYFPVDGEFLFGRGKNSSNSENQAGKNDGSNGEVE
jgi:hypothetical protein